MSTINETQRKYLRQRLESLFEQKARDIKAAEPVEAPWKSTKDKASFVHSEFARVGLDFTSTYAEYITTPKDVEYQQKLKESGERVAARMLELRNLKNSLMDDIVLGSDAEALRTAIDSLNNFAVTTNGSNN